MARVTDPERPLTFGLVGCGAISTQHLEAIAAIEGARLGGVVSASAERARSVGERWGVPWTTDLNELLDRDDIDAVAIMTPSGLHPSQALAALAHGKHVLVEKPLALSVADADAVIDEGARAVSPSRPCRSVASSQPWSPCMPPSRPARWARSR